MKTYITKHYIFNYEVSSLAEKDIERIAKEQERCFEKICETLKVNYQDKIQYYFLATPEEVGKLYGIDEPINGFAACGENKIYAVYNENIKCIGPHEDTHIISFIINMPKSSFIVEGLAMYFDEKWWGIDNEIWSAYYKEENTELSIEKLFDNDHFESLNCEITYPLAGAFTKYLIDKFGITKYIDLYKVKDDIKNNDFKRIFNYEIYELETMFWKMISKINYDKKIVELILKNHSK